MTVWHEGTTREMTEEEFLDELVFCNYKFHRRRDPSIPPKYWSLIYGGIQTAKMERRLAQEQETE